MKIQVEKLSPVEKKVVVEVEPAEVAKEIDRAYASLGRRVKLRGFRPGKAPRSVLERNFKEQVEADVVERLVQRTFGEASRDQKLDAVAAPRVEIGEGGVAADRPFSYTARVEVKPVVVPKDYRGLTVARKTFEVTDATVEAELERLRQSFGEMVPVEGRDVAEAGDWAVIDYEGSVDGKPFEGGASKGALVQVKDGNFFAGEMIVLQGRKVGDAFETEQSFPADFRDPALAGKQGRFAITLQSLRTQKMPSLDDAFAKEVGIEGVETLAALRDRVRHDIERREKRRVEAEQRDALVKAALERNDFEVPQALVERTIDAMMEQTAQRLARQGIDLRRLELDVARIRTDLREQALLTVRAALLLEAIAESEKVEVGPQDEQDELQRRAEEMGVPVSRIQPKGEGLQALRQHIREDKVVALLAAHANFT
ncbi:MAG TPA: trigger factor [Anaeromyxobacteraceae bacterium]|nr:trigger factor [Anaeromyxobacteraceae bacterium]